MFETMLLGLLGALLTGSPARKHCEGSTRSSRWAPSKR